MANETSHPDRVQLHCRLVMFLAPRMPAETCEIYWPGCSKPHSTCGDAVIPRLGLDRSHCIADLVQAALPLSMETDHFGFQGSVGLPDMLGKGLYPRVLSTQRSPCTHRLIFNLTGECN